MKRRNGDVPRSGAAHATGEARGRMKQRVVIAAIPAIALLVAVLIWLRPLGSEDVSVPPVEPGGDEASLVQSASKQEDARQRETAPPLPDLEALEAPLVARIRQLRQQVQQQPADAEAWGLLGGVFDAHDFKEQAIVCYQRAKGLNPVAFRWPYFLGYLHELDDHEAALENFLHAAQLNDEYAPLQVNIGRGYLFAEDLERAEEHFSRALELEPSLVRAWIDRAQVALTAGNDDQAMEYLEEALDLSPVSGEAHLLLSGIHQRQGRIDEAERALAFGQQLGKREPLPDPLRNLWLWNSGVTMRWHRTRGDRHLAAGRVSEAVAEWRGAVEKFPESAEAHGQLGLALVRAGQVEEGIAALRRATELDPEAHKVGKFLGGVLIQQGLAVEGLDHLRKACAGLVDDPQEQVDIITTFRQLQFYDEALQMVERALAATPDDASLLGLHGRLLLDRGRPSEAVAALKASIEAHPEDPQRHLDLAAAYEETGLYAELIETLGNARAEHPGHSGIARELAWHLATVPEPLFRDGAAAIEIMTPLCEASQFSNPAELDILAAAHAEQGNFEAAMQIARMALARLSMPEGEADGKGSIVDFDLHRALAARLELYARGVPYVQEP